MPPTFEPSRAVFLSYASQDAEAVTRICGALRAAGIEVWFDKNELTGGDVWDQKIRGQIKSCALFVPVISAATNARREGYFRREWKLAVERTNDMDEGLPFLLPVVIDATTDAGAFVPEKFREVQWTRLPGGETDAAFCARVKTLLAGEVAPVVAGVADHRPASARPATAKGRRRVPAAAWIGAAVLVLATVFWLVQRGNEMSTPPKAGVGSRPPTAANVAAPVSEARRLVAMAWEQLNRPELYRAELEIADDLCRRATVLNPDEAEAWAAWSHVDCWYVYYRLDRSDARSDSARAKAARAMKLDPRSFEARFADVHYLVRGDSASGVGRSSGEFSAAANSRLRALLVERPRDARVWFALGILLRNTGETEKAAGAFDHMGETPAFAALALSEKGWMYWQKREYRAALDNCDRSFAVQPFRGNLLLRVYLAMMWTGDLELAKTTVADAPPQILLEDDFTQLSARVAWWRRDSGEMRRVLQRVPRPWFATNSTPKGYFLGEAHQMAGERDAATAAWEESLRLVDDHLIKEPEVLALRYRKARLLALLGRSGEAMTILRLAKVSGVPVETSLTAEFSEWSISAICGDLDAAMASLEKSYLARSGWAPTWAMLRYNPVFDPLRGDPRFQAMLARAEADPLRCPHASRITTAGGETAIGATPETPKADQKSVAVLAFKNLSDDKDGEYFSEGISEELLNVLAKVPGLTVKARTSSFSFKDKSDTTQEIGRKLTVAHIVEGTVRKLGNDVRVIAHLRRTDTGDELWTDRFDGTLDKPWELQDRIAARIAQELKLKLGDTGRAAKTVNPEAYRLVLEGRYFWNLRTEDFFARAEVAFNKALEIESNFAEAHSGLAVVFMLRDLWRAIDGFERTPGEAGRARDEAQRALMLEPSLAEAHAVLGYLAFNEGKLVAADAAYQMAFSLDPNRATFRQWHAHVNAAAGRLDLTIADYKKSNELDPLSPINLDRYADALAYSGRFSEALAISDRAIPLRAADLSVANRARRALIFAKLGRVKEAVAAAHEVRQAVNPRQRLLADAEAIWALRISGLETEAAEFAAEALARLPAKSYVRGFVLAAIGDLERAIPLLETQPMFSVREMYWGEMWDPFRNDPRFNALLAKLGLTNEYKVARETLARMQKEQAGKK